MNVVPYIDVMLVLLVIFMVTAPMLVQGVQIELPKVAAEALPAPGQQRIVTLSVKADGSYYWNLGSEVDTRSQTDSAVDTAQMRDKIAAIVAQDPQTQVYLRADRNTEYAAVVAGIAELQRGGVSRLGLITEAP
ncbi:Biopolymer transport protein ExbD [compost metagenome]